MTHELEMIHLRMAGISQATLELACISPVSCNSKLLVLEIIWWRVYLKCWKIKMFLFLRWTLIEHFHSSFTIFSLHFLICKNIFQAWQLFSKWRPGPPVRPPAKFFLFWACPVSSIWPQVSSHFLAQIKGPNLIWVDLLNAQGVPYNGSKNQMKRPPP